LAKLDLSNGTKGFTARDLVAGSASLSTRLSNNLSAFSWTQGVGQITTAHVFQRAAAPDGPYTNTSLGLQVTDTDGASVAAVSLDTDTTGDGAADSALLALLDLRHGRIRLGGASSGPSDAMPVVFRTEFFNGSDWSTMSIDSCSSISRSAITYPAGTIDDAGNLNVTVGGGQSTGSYASSSASTVSFQQGDAGHAFSAPGAGNLGTFSVDVSVSGLSWLQFDWNGDGQHNDTSLPTAQYEFSSRFRGHDRVLHWKQD
jgi:MSHA biogenesis protein MshQ